MKRLVLVLAMSVLASACSTTKRQTLEPVRFDAEKECDVEHLQLPQTDPDGRAIGPSDWVQVEDVRVIEKANADCGRKAIEAADRNYQAAMQKREPERGFFARVWDAVKGPVMFGAGILIGAAVL